MVDRSAERAPGTGRDRGQAHTLEAVVAAVLLIGSLTFALQVTAVTPLSASTSSQHIENQQAATAEGVLAGAIEDGSLRRGLLYCDPAADDRDPTFNSTGDDPYYVDAPTINHSGNLTGFGERLEAAFGERSIAYNVILVYEHGGSTVRREMIYQGTPSDNAVTASRTVALFDADNLSQPVDNATLETTGGTLTDGTCYGSDSVADGSLHKVVKVEVIVWRQ
ncbi:hypothetical protein BRC94_11020 [Halobacteriales archaeon QS_5_70_17]|nr:MAG: hypothetical protein BRC94_11020 [Halobacteriales archaeon QS_5_70_17]